MTGAPCAAFRPSQARVLCASAPLPEPRALLLWPGPHRQLRPLRVSPRRAVQARQAARSSAREAGLRSGSVSFPGQRRLRSLRKVRTTKIRPGLSLRCVCVCVCARISQRKLLGGRVRHARVLLLACLACCGPRLSVLLEVRNCRLWPLPGTSSCRRPLRRKRSSDSSTVVCLTWIDAGSTSQSRYFQTFVAWLWFLQDKGFDEPTEQARAGWQDAVRESCSATGPGRSLMHRNF